MKASGSLHSFLLLFGSIFFTASFSHAANRWWDGGSVDIAGNGNGASTGGAGTWNTTFLNWDAGASPHVAWNNANNDTAIFAGTGAAIALTAPITVGGLTFSSTGYTFTSAVPATNFISVASGGVITSVAGTNALANVSLAAGNDTWRFQNSNTTTAFANATVLTISKAISGTGTNVVISGNGSSPVFLTGTLSHTGTTTVNAGAVLSFATTSVASLTSASISMGAGSTLMRQTAIDNTFLGKIASTSNAFTLIQTNGSTANALDLTNFENASLAVWDNGNTQTFSYNGAITAGSNGYRFGSARTGASNWINVGATLASGAASITTTFANVLTGSSNLELLSGSGSGMRIFGSQTYSGTTKNSASGRTLIIGSNLALQNSAIDTSGAGVFGVYDSTNNAQDVKTPTIGGLIGSKNISGTGGLFDASYSTITALTLNPGTGKDHTYSGIIANGAADMTLTKTGEGTQVLSGLNSFTGNVTVGGGILAAGVSGNGTNSALGNLSNTRTINVNTGGTLRIDVGNVFSGSFDAEASTLPVLNLAGGTMTNSGAATNSALGNITLAGGTLAATTGSPVGTGSGQGYGSWNLNGTITSTGTSTLSTTASGGVPFTLSAAAGNSFITTFDVQSGTLTASTPLGEVTREGNERTSGLTKTGAGTMILSATNSYNGQTNVDGGKLEISSTGSTASGSAVTVSNSSTEFVINGTVNGTLFANVSTIVSGTGTIGGAATIQGIHNPGNSPGIQTFGDNLTYSGGSSVVNWELAANTITNAANPNAVYDQILVNGDLDFAALTTVNLNFATGGVLWASTFWETDQSWVVYDVTGTTTNFDNLSLNTINWADSGSNPFNTARPDSSFSLSLSGDNILLNYTVIPETSTTLLGGLGALALLRRRRK